VPLTEYPIFILSLSLSLSLLVFKRLMERVLNNQASYELGNSCTVHKLKCC
jgi:hypothetical protein